MKILYHLTTLPPKMPACEALSQEISALQARFGGDLIFLNPNRHSPFYVPRVGFGLQQLKSLRDLEADLDLHHLYNPDPFPFPVLRGFRRPIVYTVSSGVRGRRPRSGFLSSLAAVTVYDERSLRRLRSWGFDNVVLVRSGIDTARFTFSPIPLKTEIRLMVGSAPWTRQQFRTKGVDALLAAAQHAPHLHLTFLWRGVLADEMQRRVLRMRLEKQVTVVDKRVDPNQVLANVHASVCLATDPAIIKSYPHSLMESLAAGKPVIVSRAIPMSDYVDQTGCGRIVERVTASDTLDAIESLSAAYGDLRLSAKHAGRRDFSQEKMIDSFEQVYEQVLDRPSAL